MNDNMNNFNDQSNGNMNNSGMNMNNLGMNQPMNMNNPGMNQQMNMNNPGMNQPMNMNNSGMNQQMNMNNPEMNQQMNMNNPGMNQQMNMNNSGMNQQMNMNNPGMNQPNKIMDFIKKNQKILIIAGIALLAVIILCTCVFNKKDKATGSDYKDWQKEEEKEKSKIIKNINYKVETKLHNGELLVSLESKNKGFVDVDIPIKFYDEEHIQLKEEKAYFFCVENGTKLYDVVYAPDKYATYEIMSDSIDASSVDEKYNDSCVSYKGKYEASSSFDGDESEYKVVFTNNTAQTISARGLLLLYKGDSVYDVDSVIYSSIPPKGKGQDNVYFSEYEGYKPSKTEFVLTNLQK